MIFYGWGKTTELEYGELNSTGCSLCDESNQWILTRIIKWFTLFFIPVIPYSIKYYKKCKNCGSLIELEKSEAREIISDDFTSIRNKNMLKGLGKYSALLIIAVVIFTYWKFTDDEVNYKDLVEPDSNRYFSIYDIEGNLKASIDSSGNSLVYDVYVYETEYTEEENNTGHIFTSYDYYYEREENELSYIEDNAAAIVDDLGIGIRYYWYDSYDNSLYWYIGVENFDDIKYSNNSVIYPLQVLNENNKTEYYEQVYLFDSDYEVIAIYEIEDAIGQPKKLYQTQVNTLMDGNVSHTNLYYGQLEGINIDSSIEDILACIDENQIDPDEVTQYSYFQETKVPSKVTYTYENPQTNEKVTDEYNYSVYEKDGYYIQSW